MDHVARIHHSLSEIPAADWAALDTHGSPFLAHAFLDGLERTGCIRRELGWRPHHLALYRDDVLVAAAPCYRKANSHGEFVFDFSWAQAHERAELEYYPKLLVAVPYTPVSGPRLLVRTGEPEATRDALVAALDAERARLGASSVHANFVRDDDADALARAGWLARGDWQFHWENAGYATFDDFLAALSHKRRKEIRRERARFGGPDWTFEWRDGAALDEATLDFVHECYVTTFAEKGNYPALTREFFGHLARTMPTQVAALVARHEGEPTAMAFCLRDERTLYGRYWGSLATVPLLHFEACYYQGIDYCIANGIARFEPGAQGEHKIARG
ncbi:MAG TPA: GNAT family N-acetyltransferase, partial [Xanthomonadales bacterium]|nr:GNAT family N-acetyltransferase [Xanthomonadales bacterium]